jgi:antitoxin component YwqK of YwqJK toxin-antitoxin module
MVKNYQLSNEDKILIDGKLKEDIFNQTDPENQIRPEVLLIDYYRLNNMDFNWIILDPMSKAVTEYSEKNKSNLSESIKIISSEQKLLFFWWYLDGQVTNGGFSQFLFNGYDKYFQPILNGLKLLPNKTYYELVEKVYLFYLKEQMGIVDRDKIEKFLSDANAEYFRINEQLYKDVENFIRDNQISFIKPIEKNYTGLIEHKTDNHLELLEVQNGIPEGKYERYRNNVKEQEIIYSRGKSVIEKKFRIGQLYEEKKNDDTVKNLEHTLEYYPNGKLKSHLKRILKDRHNWDLISSEKFYDSGIIKEQYWQDDTQKNHIKRYFSDGHIRSYHTYKNRDDDSGDNLAEYLICFDENRKETLINGNGIFYDHGFKEPRRYGFYSTVLNCKNYLANGESLHYKDGILWLKTNYVNGLKNGLDITYHKNGNEEIREYENGKFIRRIK